MDSLKGRVFRNIRMVQHTMVILRMVNGMVMVSMYGLMVVDMKVNFIKDICMGMVYFILVRIKLFTKDHFVKMKNQVKVSLKQHMGLMKDISKMIR